MNREEKAAAFWGALAIIGAGGIMLYIAGVRPRTPLQREIIPVNEPTIFDWASIGGALVLN